MSIVPSYILKANRAEHHLHDLKVAIGKWADTHPYEVRTTHYRNRDAHHLRFTGSVPPEIGMIAADFVYNIRSGLDHLMASLVPATKRSKVYFPIYFQGVWEDPVPGEDEKRAKERIRWKSDTVKVRPEAVAILKSLQPPEDTREVPDTAHAFGVINKLSNTDRHQRLPLVFMALRGVRLIGIMNGQPFIGPADTGTPADLYIAKDGTELRYPKGSVDMKIAGSPVVAVHVPQDGDIDVPDVFDTALRAFRERAVFPLSPYIHSGAAMRSHDTAP